MIKLYHYVHCPFCIRARLAFGILQLPYQSHVLSYDDEKRPIELMNKKMLPIASFEDGQVLNESLDIIKKSDPTNRLSFETYEQCREDFDQLLNELASPIHNLVMPYWVYTQEFNEGSRQYFLKKKEAKRGPFNKLMKRKYDFLSELEPILSRVEKNIEGHYLKADKITILDIMLSSHLWGLYILPEFQFTPKLHNYLQKIKTECSFEYHQDYWV